MKLQGATLGSTMACWLSGEAAETLVGVVGHADLKVKALMGCRKTRERRGITWVA